MLFVLEGKGERDGAGIQSKLMSKQATMVSHD